MTDDEIDAAIRAAIEMPVTRDIFLKSYERSLFRAGYRAGVMVAAAEAMRWPNMRPFSIDERTTAFAIADAIRALAY